MKQVVYVLTGVSETKGLRLAAGTQLSIMSLRNIHPDAVVLCLCDQDTERFLLKAKHPLCHLASQIISCHDAVGGPVHRSRFLKTTMRRRVSGPFIYLDSDTVVVGPLDELFDCPTDLGLTLDLYFKDAPGTFPSWLASHYKRLGWTPTRRYFNSGVLFVADTDAAQYFFHEWNQLWLLTVRDGLTIDQAALNRAVETARPQIQVYSEFYNLLTVNK